jgi:hypothetical protein
MGLVVVQQQQTLRSALGDLPGDLGADGPTGTGDEHTSPREHGPDRLQVGDDLFAAEQVLDAEVAHVAQRGAAVHRREHPGHDLQRHVRGLGYVRGALHGLLRSVRHGEDGQVGAGLAHHLGEIVDAAAHADSHERAALELRVVVDHRHGAKPGFRAAQHLCHQARTGVTGTDHHHAEAGHRRTAPEREQPRLEPDEGHEEGGQDGSEREHQHRHGRRHRLHPLHHDHRAERAQDGHARQHQPAGLEDAGVAPQLPVETPGPVGHHDHHQRQRKEEAERRPEGRRDGAVESEQQGGGERGGCKDHVEHDHQGVAAHPHRARGHPSPECRQRMPGRSPLDAHVGPASGSDVPRVPRRRP